MSNKMIVALLLLTLSLGQLMDLYNQKRKHALQACQIDVLRQELNALKHEPYNRPACLDEYLKPKTKLPSMFYNSPEVSRAA